LYQVYTTDCEGSVSNLIRVVPEDLHVSAANVDAHADELHLRHAAANGRIQAAQVGVPTGSAAALSVAVAKWQTDTSVLFGNLLEHGRALRSAAAGYVGSDDDNAADIEAVSDQVSTLDVGLPRPTP
jgi:hypothetical protein